MKQTILKMNTLLLLSVITLSLWSCSKTEPVQPALPTQSNSSAEGSQSNSLNDEALLPGEIAAAQPSPGVYVISKFIDTRDDKTSLFTGYTFEFQADGDFIATTNTNNVFNGSWSLNSAGTVMTINISGNAKLKNLDDDNWKVARITNIRIKLTAPGPDVVVFTKQS